MLSTVGAITLLRILWLCVQPADLYPDEAQYWFWAKHLAFGYYSKPPLVAWLIALTTALFGDGEAAVRLSAPLLAAGAAVCVYGVGARLYGSRVGFWAGLAFASLPGVSVSGFIISTDAPLMLCWAAALYAFIRAREGSGWGWWIATGIAAGLGLLAKYAMAYWMGSALGFVVLVRAERRHFWPLVAAIAIAIALYAPNFLWNWQNGFASYLHTRDNADLGSSLFHPEAFLRFFGAQFAVFGPLFFACLVWLALSPRIVAEPRARLLAVFALPTLGMMLALSFVSRAHANWAAPAYISATVLVTAAALRLGWRRIFAAAIAFHLAAAALLFTGYQTLAAVGIELPGRYDPLMRLRGWSELGNEVGGVLARHPGYHLFADDRETLAALIYYVHPHPFDAVKWELQDRVGDGWDLTNNMSKYLGDNFLLVAQHDLVAEMRPSFAAIVRIGSLTIPLGPGEERRYGLYLARDFRGYPQYRAPGITAADAGARP